MPKKTFYITTPIYYPSGKPHIGTVYTNIVTDSIARWHKLLGEDVFFSTGTDEHAQKVEKEAKEKGLDTKAYVDTIIPHFKDAFKKYNISYDKFVRTTDEDHKKYCQKLVKKLYDQGDIYKGKYEGWYCNGCETYYTEKDLVDGKCPLHGTKATWFEEEAYFFKMSKYEKKVIDYIKKNNYITPKYRQEFILSRMKDGVRDLCISRTNSEWGISLPWDHKHKIWVWFDALPNYTSNTASSPWKKFWPANVHVIAHDIIWHHSVIWLSMLLAAGIELPKKLLVHGFIMGEGGLKMSKSLGNVIDPLELLKKYPVDSVRYFLLREIPLGSDGAFSYHALRERHNSELVNGLGNLHARTLSMVEKYYSGKIVKSPKNELPKKFNYAKFEESMSNFELHNALSEIMHFVNECNKYINDNVPWELAKNNKKRLDIVMYNLADSLRLISILIEPFMPETSENIQKSLGMKKKEDYKKAKFGLLGNNKLEKVGYLFTRIDEGETMQKKETKVETKPVIPFTDFEKLDLRVAKIIKVENHPNADKLYVLQLSLGSEKKQIVAGLRSHYKPEQLLNKKIIIINNLQPTVLRGVESNGMLLAASKDQKVVFLTPESDIPEGAKIS
ncbi:methionine--tRNA ligase [Candidatus Woesearchaeota archaeon]|nr:methionine--tRNA ligase [Candidatus Woesearchaeota archaeon]